MGLATPLRSIRAAEFQLGVLAQVAEYDLGDGVALEYHDDALIGAAAALVPDLGDATDGPRLGKAGDLLR